MSKSRKKSTADYKYAKVFFGILDDLKIEIEEIRKKILELEQKLYKLENINIKVDEK